MKVNREILIEYIDNFDDENLKSIVETSTRDGEKEVLDEMLLDILFSEPRYQKNIDEFLEKVLFSPNEIAIETDIKIPIQTPEYSHTHVNKPDSLLEFSGAEGINPYLEHLDLSNESTHEEVVQWLQKEISKEFISTESEPGATERRSTLLQVRSVLKYASGDSIGLQELLEYGDNLNPLASWMLVRCTPYSESPSSLLKTLKKFNRQIDKLKRFAILAYY